MLKKLILDGLFYFLLSQLIIILKKVHLIYCSLLNFIIMGIGLVPSESKFLERSRTALANAASNVEIRSKMAKFGMDEEKLQEGLNLHDRASSQRDRHEQEGIESRLASNAYRQLFEDLQALFK